MHKGQGRRQEGRAEMREACERRKEQWDLGAKEMAPEEESIGPEVPMGSQGNFTVYHQTASTV